MGFAGFLGNALIAGGPGLALFCVFIAQRSFLLLLFLARYIYFVCISLFKLCGPQALTWCSPYSLFAWLISLILTAALFRGARPYHSLPASVRRHARTVAMPCCSRAGLVPLSEHPGALPAALVVGVAAQEATRYCAWLAHRHVPQGLIPA